MFTIVTLLLYQCGQSNRMRRYVLFEFMLYILFNFKSLFFFSVCESVINKLRAQLPDDAKPEEIELQFKEFCKKAQGKDEKFVSIF